MRKGTFSLFLAPVFLVASATASAAPFKPPAQAESAVKIAPEVSAEGAAPRLATSPAPLSSSERERYAERQRNSPDAKQFKGGDATVVIGASTATVILAVVLLIVLL
jgi:hypothetical protein